MAYIVSKFNIEYKRDNQSVVYNTRTGALITLEEPLESFMANHPDKIEKLNELGFIVEENINELNRFIAQRNYTIHNENPEALQIDIAPTLYCQAKCFYCFENNMNYVGTMTEEVVEDTIKYIENLIKEAAPKKFIISFFGGEPLLNKKAILQIGEKVKEYCSKNKIVFESKMVSNGILFDYQTAKKLVETCNLKEIQITLDGLKDTYAQIKGVDEFDTVVNNIVEASSLVYIIIRLNVNKQNRKEIKELIQYLLKDKELDGKVKVYLANTDDVSPNRDNTSQYYDESEYTSIKNEMYLELSKKYKSIDILDVMPKIRKAFCNNETNVPISIGPKGELYKCEAQYGMKNCIIGNVKEGRFYNEHDMCFSHMKNTKCLKDCYLLPYCLGKCPDTRKDINYDTCYKEQYTKLISNINTYIEGRCK